MARYVAIGSASFQTHVLLPPLDALETSTPFAIAVSPSGTVTLKSNVALSRGLSLHGYHVGEPCGSPTTLAAVARERRRAAVHEQPRNVEPAQVEMKLDRLCVALAVMTAVATSEFDDGV